jgi:hypothetical protein
MKWAILILIAYACLPVSTAKADVWANGIICQPSSASGMIYTATSIRNGNANNRTAYCQISPAELNSTGGYLQVFMRNHGTEAKDVTCTVKIGGTSGSGYSTVTQVTNIPAGGTSIGTVSQFQDLARNYYDVLAVVCTLPQNLSIEWIGYYENAAI